MVNNETAKSTYVVTSGVNTFTIGFAYNTNPDGAPQIKVYKNKASNTPLQYDQDYTLSLDGLSIVVSADLEVGDHIDIIRDIPMVQLSDYIIGRIAPEQIERDFDQSVMRDQQLKADMQFIAEVPLDHEERIQECEEDISEIEALVPTQATSSNKLADKDFVNSSIATSTATFRGTYSTLADLEAVTADDNDYGFVESVDATGNTVYSRYKYNGTSWVFEYNLNNSSFTAAQWAAINSGITSTIVDGLSGVTTVVSDVATLKYDVSGLKDGSNFTSTGKANIVGLLMPDYSQGQNVSLTGITQWTAPVDCFVSYQSGLKNGAMESLSIGNVRVCLIQQAASSFVYTTVGFYMKAGQILTGLSPNDINRDSTIYYFPLGV